MAKILVVDDEPVTRAALERVLSQSGHVVSMAQNGREGLDRAAAEQPDLIIMDIKMPEMDGLQATEKLRKTPGLAAVRVIVLTGDETVLNRFAAHKAGSDAYLRKPVEQDVLIATINRLLR